MGRPRPATPVKLFCGLLAGDVDVLRRARQLLTHEFGAVDYATEPTPFAHTTYYQNEMGPNLLRVFVSFATLIRPDTLAELKLRTNALEDTIAEQYLLPESPRPVNIDPGYVDLGKVVLATTKDRAHRVYLQRGIFAEVTLQYHDGAWRVQPWTYPDYALPETHAFCDELRRRLRELRRSLGLGEAYAEPPS
jgi:hypothetical protein